MALIRISNGPEEVGRAQFSLTQYLHCRCIQHTYISTSGLELESDGAYQNIKWTRGGRKSSIQFGHNTYTAVAYSIHILVLLGLSLKVMALIRISNGPEEVGRAQFSLDTILTLPLHTAYIY